jgi:hypothetical protein
MKAAIVLWLVLGLAPSVHAQGTVAFNNLASTNFRLWTNGPGPRESNLINGASYRIGLYGSTDLNAPESSLSLLLLATNPGPAAFAGYFNGGSVAFIPGLAAGTTIRFQLRGWSLFAGQSFEQARTASQVDPLNVALGLSPLGTATLGGGIVPPGLLFGTAPGLLTEGFLIGVPEPSAYALAALGVLFLAGIRRHLTKETRRR